MKTEVEINGFEVCIEDVDGKVAIKIDKNDETIEEMTFDPSEYDEASNDEEEEIKAFGDDDDDDDSEEDDSDDDSDEETIEERVKSFGDYLNG